MLASKDQPIAEEDREESPLTDVAPEQHKPQFRYQHQPINGDCNTSQNRANTEQHCRKQIVFTKIFSSNTITIY